MGILRSVYNNFQLKLKIMEIKDFVLHFAEQFEDTPVEDFAPETRFRDLDEWSSLLALSIIAMIDEEYDITLKGDDMRKANTIEELFNIVCEKA